MVQGKCDECGAHPEPDDHASFSGGAGARCHQLPDEEYRQQMRKLVENAGE
jgi:hypothetical protein